MGLMGMLVPTELGWAGMGYAEYVIALEELARVDPSVALIVAAHNSLCCNHIFLFGTEEQKRLYLPRVASGELIMSFALTEPDAGSDSASIKTRGERDGDEKGDPAAHDRRG